MNKKGAEGTIWTIIVIILALVVLVVLVVGFTGGWGKLWSKITSFSSGANVDTVVQACEMACTTNAKYDYCIANRILRSEGADGKLQETKVTCNKLVSVVPSVTLNCPDIDCPV